MGKKVRISDESVNCYGTRIITDGIELTQYEKNPVLLYMHERGKVVGVVKNLKKEHNELIGELEFDCASPLSEQLKKQYDFGSLKMVSANLRVIETSNDKKLAKEGQTAETITRCQLFEVSCVDIGGNDNALVLSDPDGNTISLSESRQGTSLLPLLNPTTPTDNINPINKTSEMKTEELALSLGLAATATEAEITAKITELKLSAEQSAKQQKQIAEMQLAAISAAVDTAIREKRINATLKDHFIDLGKKVGIEELNITLGAIQPQQKLTEQLHKTDHASAPTSGEEYYQKLARFSEVPASKIDDLIENHHDQYCRLFKAEYGVDPSTL